MHSSNADKDPKLKYTTKSIRTNSRLIALTLEYSITAGVIMRLKKKYL